VIERPDQSGIAQVFATVSGYPLSPSTKPTCTLSIWRIHEYNMHKGDGSGIMKIYEQSRTPTNSYTSVLSWEIPSYNPQTMGGWPYAILECQMYNNNSILTYLVRER
jgi:hypothetical protein